MNKLFPFLALVITFIIAGCAQPASEEIGFGHYDGNTYHNDFFGLKIEIPADWSIQDQEAQRQIQEIGKELHSGGDENMQALLDASELQTVNLLAAFKYPQGSPVTSNPSIMGIAEKLVGMPGVQRGSDYLFHARTFLESGNMNYTFPEEVYSVDLGGKSFDVLKGVLRFGSVEVEQLYYAHVTQRYALSFIVSYTTKDEKAELMDILNTLELSK